MEKLKKLAKQCLGIIETATLKDDEIEMLINSAKADMDRVDIDVNSKIDDSLIVNTIILYVKAHYGDTDINKRKEYLDRYVSNIRALKESEEYRKGVGSNA